jgi:hypothetical protein
MSPSPTAGEDTGATAERAVAEIPYSTQRFASPKGMNVNSRGRNPRNPRNRTTVSPTLKGSNRQLTD